MRIVTGLALAGALLGSVPAAQAYEPIPSCITHECAYNCVTYPCYPTDWIQWALDQLEGNPD